jgi:GAF domain-containing protein
MNSGNAAARDGGLLQVALDQVAEVCWARLPCERVTVMLADGEGRDAVLGVAAWRGELAPEAVNARVSSGSSVAGEVFASGRARRVADADVQQAGGRARGEGGSFICTPLPLDGRILGVINVRRSRGQPAFSEVEEDVLDCLALFGGKSVQTAQLAFLVKSEFARRALQGEEVSALAEAFSQGAAQPAQVARMLAKSFYREMKAAGFGNNQIVGAAGEIIDQLSASLRKHGQRMERGRQ